jgi:hypothetical protein
VTITPLANRAGIGSFTYTVSDGAGGTATGTITVNTLADPLTGQAATFKVYNEVEFNSALLAVQPGDTIIFYGRITCSKPFTTSRDGTPSAPITITGDSNAVIYATGNYGLQVLHDNYRFSNFSIENSDKGMVIDNANNGIVHNVHCMDIQNEAFKIRNQSKNWLFTFCSARRTGLEGEYGEGFYVGQADSNWIDDKPDECSYITFFNCYTTDTYNDGFDIKEGSHHIKLVNCTADYSGSIEPNPDAKYGSSGFYLRGDNIQVIKCSVNQLGNGDWAFRSSNTTADNDIDYGNSGNELKQCGVTGGDVHLIYSEKGTNVRVYTDCVPGPGGLVHSSSASVNKPEPSAFIELTWPGIGGEIYGTLSSVIGVDDTLTTPNTPPTAPDATIVGTSGDQKIATVAFPSIDADGHPVTLTNASSGLNVTVHSFTATTVTITPLANRAGIGSFTYTVSDGVGGTATGTITVNVTNKPFDIWRFDHFTDAQLTAAPEVNETTATAAPAGIANLLRFALEPLSGGVASLPQASRAADGSLIFSFQRNLQATDLELQVEACNALDKPAGDPNSWQPLAIRPAGASAWISLNGASVSDNNGEVKITERIGTGSMRLFRLKVALP